MRNLSAPLLGHAQGTTFSAQLPHPLAIVSKSPDAQQGTVSGGNYPETCRNIIGRLRVKGLSMPSRD
eukprot:scaffold43505_cov13-Tisochrysis_lutea.AAC.1